MIGEFARISRYFGDNVQQCVGRYRRWAGTGARPTFIGVHATEQSIITRSRINVQTAALAAGFFRETKIHEDVRGMRDFEHASKTDPWIHDRELFSISGKAKFAR